MAVVHFGFTQALSLLFIMPVGASSEEPWRERLRLVRVVQDARELGYWTRTERALLRLRREWPTPEVTFFIDTLSAEAKLRQGTPDACEKALRREYLRDAPGGSHSSPAHRQFHVLLVHVGVRPLVQHLERYYAEHVEFPATHAALRAAVKAKPRVFKDPWGRPYQYQAIESRAVPGVPRQQYRIGSSGPDGKAGTEDDVSYRRTLEPPSAEARKEFEARQSWGGYLSTGGGKGKRLRVRVTDRASGKVTLVGPGDRYQGAEVIATTPEFVLLLKSWTVMIVERPQ